MSAILKILIADDEAPARNRLRDLLFEINTVELVAEAKHGKEALDLANEKSPDVLLLDIRMPVMDGLETAAHAQQLEPKPSIIFTTAFDTFALKAFEVNAVDYLLKPIRLARLQTALEKARASRPNLQAPQLANLQPMRKARTHFSVHERGRVLLIALADVIYLRAEQKYISVRTLEREYLVEDSLTQIEAEFGDYFIRLHRNCLVVPSKIKGYEKRQTDDESHWVALLHGISDVLAVSRRQQHLIKQL